MAKIAIDIDSTLHHYWGLLERIARQRYGVAIPYAEQRSWGITQLERHQLVACIEESHTDTNILACDPYPGAVETVRGWHGDGHWIHVTSHRALPTREATAAWLDRIGLPWHDLHCSYDKVTRCVELGIDVLVDDSPVNLTRARDEGIIGATLIHPWNEAIVGEEGIVAAGDWPALRERLAPALRPDAGRRR
ncbi:MAG: hypothetical protein WD844_17065 [Thermoleophilaceae bacterium]